jgi:hypothetical protein
MDEAKRMNIPLADMRQAAETDLATRLGVRSVLAPASSSAVETTDNRGDSAPTFSPEEK